MNFFGARGGPYFRFRWRGRDVFGPDFGPEPPSGLEDTDDDDEERVGPRPFGGLRTGFMELYRRSFSKRIDAGYEARLRIENRNGLISIRTHDQPSVVINVTAELYADSQEDADREAGRLERSITSEGDLVEVRTPDLPRPEFFFFGRGPKVDYDILVPADTEVWASNRNGPVEVRGIRRLLQVENRNGRVTGDDLGGEVKVENRNGKVALTRCAGPVTAESTNGAISVEQVQGAVAIQTRNGPLEVVQPGAGVRAHTTNGSITFRGRVHADVELEARNGAVRVAVTPDSRFEIDAESRHGSVRSDIPVRERPPAQGAGPPPKVRIRTTNGSIRLSEL